MKISDLKLNPKNPQKYKDLSKLEKSIKEFPKMMELRPMVYDPETMFVLGGNKRLICLQKLGFKEIPDTWVRSAAELTEEEKKRFIIADNVGFGEWDWELLKEDYEIPELEDWGIEVPVNEKKLEAKEDDFEVSDEIQTDIKPGDIFQIGQHRLMCGDSTDPEQVAKLMNGEKADMIFTDPPYDLENIDCSINISLFSENAHVFVMHSDNGIVNYLRHSNLEFHRFYVANFGFASPRGNDPYLQHILISHEKNGNPIPHQNMHDSLRSIIKMEYRHTLKDEKTGHKHQKSIEFESKFIKHFSKKGMLIFDLFGGSGTTMVIAEQTRRRCYTMEIDTKYCQMIINRMEQIYKLKAVKL